MLVFLDNMNKTYYIMAPKCGTTSIAKWLNVDLHSKHDLSNINNPEYKKVIILRNDILERFLSGFYEDLFNNSCYNSSEVKFNDYLLFLYECFKKKIPFVNNMNLCSNKDMPIWYGNCSNVSLPITDSNGNFVSHIQSQKYAISSIVSLITDKTNVKVIELNDLSIIVNNIRENEKRRCELPDNIDFSELTLSYIKENRIIVNKNYLTEKQKDVILEMYKEDLVFINDIETKFLI